MKKVGLLEQIQNICGCFYLSDLHFEPYNSRARQLLERLNLNRYSLLELYDALHYIFSKK